MKRLGVLGLIIAVGCGDNDHDGHSGKGPLPTTRAIPTVDSAALFVVNGGDASISVIDATTFESLGTIVIEGASFPHHIGVSPDHTKLIVSIPGIDLSAGHDMGGHAGHGDAPESFLMVLDARSGETLVARRLDAPAHNGIFSPDGSEVWAGQMKTAGEVLVLDATTLETQEHLDVGSMPAEVTLNSSGSRVFVANSESDSVTVFDAATKDLLDTISVDEGPVGAWAGSDNVMYVDNEQGQSITAIDATTLGVVRTYSLGFTPAMAMTAPGDVLLITDTDVGRLVFNSTEADAESTAIGTAAGAHAVIVAGTSAFVTNQMAGTVSVVDLTGVQVIETVAVGDKPNGAVYVVP